MSRHAVEIKGMVDLALKQLEGYGYTLKEVDDYFGPSFDGPEGPRSPEVANLIEIVEDGHAAYLDLEGEGF